MIWHALTDPNLADGKRANSAVVRYRKRNGLDKHKLHLLRYIMYGEVKSTCRIDYCAQSVAAVGCGGAVMYGADAGVSSSLGAPTVVA